MKATDIDFVEKPANPRNASPVTPAKRLPVWAFHAFDADYLYEFAGGRR